MKVTTIKDKINKYEVITGINALSDFLEMFNFPTKIMVVTTKKILSLCDKKILEKGFDFIFVGENETEKSIDNYLLITKELTRLEYTKSDLIIALGGGVISDLVGFVAATYKRGINFVIVPTTLLSMIDASIGGKNGLNFEGIKNVLGSFYSPNMVIASYEFLDSLTNQEFLSGLLEALKAGIIGDKELVNIIKNNTLEKIRNNIFIIDEIINRSIVVKKKIVEIDPYEEDLRRVLNLGHTIGHAIEALNINKISHGEAVFLGMIPFLNNSIKEEVKAIITNYLNIKDLNLDKESLLSYIKEDKKIKNDKLHIVYVNNYEDVEIKEITLDEIKEKLDEINIW